MKPPSLPDVAELWYISHYVVVNGTPRFVWHVSCAMSCQKDVCSGRPLNWQLNTVSCRVVDSDVICPCAVRSVINPECGCR